MKVKVNRVAENTLIVYFGDAIDPQLVTRIALFTKKLQTRYGESLYEVIPSYTSVLIEYHPLKVNHNELMDWCEQQAQQVLSEVAASKPKVVTLPVYYHPEVAPDLESLATARQLSVEQVIEIHSQQEYTVCAIGFAPGFAFLGSVDPRIASPRHSEPRLKVAKGSVGIADKQTAIYPQETPGGWQIIGNCPTQLFDINNDPMMPFEIGDTVRFAPITRDEFLALGGKL